MSSVFTRVFVLQQLIGLAIQFGPAVAVKLWPLITLLFLTTPIPPLPAPPPQNLPALSVPAPGALSIPVGDLRRRLKELARSKEYVAYCRGPYCIYADQAVEILRANGRRARRLAEGFPEWRFAGFPVSHGAEPGALRGPGAISSRGNHAR